MKKIFKIFVIALMTFLGVTGCDSNHDVGDDPKEVFNLNIVDNENLLFEGPSKNTFFSGEELTFYFLPLVDKDIEMYVDNEFYAIQSTTTLSGVEMYSFSYTMPNKDTTVEFKTISRLVPTGTFKLTIIDNNNLVYDKPTYDLFTPGTVLQFHTEVLIDADVEMYVDNVFYSIQRNITLTDREVFEFTFTMPINNVTIEFKIKTIEPPIPQYWTAEEEALIKSYCNNIVLPYIAEGEYDAYEYNGTLVIEADEIYFSYFTTYLNSIKALFGEPTSSYDYYFEFAITDNIQLGLVYYEEEYSMQLGVYGVEEIDTSKFLEQTDFTNEDKNLYAPYLTKDLPFAKCYSYSCSMQEYNGEFVYIEFYTSYEEAMKYETALKNVFKYDSDDYGLYFGDGNTIIEYYLEEETNYYSVSLAIYDYGEPVFEEEVDPTPVGEGILLSASTMKTLTLSYNKSATNCTVDGVSFVYTNMARADSYTPVAAGGVQHKKDNTLKNETPISGVTTITIRYVYSYSATGNYYEITGGTSSKSLNQTATRTLVSTITNNPKSYIVEYTFDTPVNYLEFRTHGACYFYEIIIGGTYEPAKPDIDLEDDGNGFMTVDFTKADYTKVSDLDYYVDSCPSIGDINILVIPVQFSDCTAQSKGYSIDVLKKVFNGPDDDSLMYTNVANYFKVSSYGKLNLTFDVLDDWYTAKKTASQYERDYENTRSYPTDIWGYSGEDSYCTPEMTILNDALEALDDTIDFTKYDNNNDGSIDGIVMVYTEDFNSDDDSLYWAWQYFNYLGDTSNPYYEDGQQYGYDYYYYDECYANAYLWASYGFLFDEAIGNKMNTYTFVHEFSHLIGSNDYYDTSYDGFNPTHDLDIMDYTYADHTAYTKMLYGWIDNARVVTTENTVTLTLNSIQTSGDVIILCNSYDTKLGVFQEYYTIEYYTNTANNSKGGLFDNEGIVVHHVNSVLTIDEDGYADIKNNNTQSGDYASDDDLYELISSGSSYLFEVGDTLSGVKLDNGAQLGFSFTVDSIENGVATLTFTRIA